MTDTDKIRTATSAKRVNAILESGEALVKRGRGRWAFTVNGTIKAEGTFREAREAAALYNDA